MSDVDTTSRGLRDPGYIDLKNRPIVLTIRATESAAVEEEQDAERE